MARRRKRKRNDSSQDLVLPIVFILTGFLFLHDQLGIKFDLSTFEPVAPLIKLVLALAVFIFLMAVVVKILKKYFEKFERKNLVRKQKYINDWSSMSPEIFEHFVAGLYEKEGYQVDQITNYRADHGIDVVLKRGSKRYAIQVKQYKKLNKISEKDLREFYGSYVNKYDGGTFVTTSSFTRPAQEWAKGVGMHLVDGNLLVKKVNR